MVDYYLCSSLPLLWSSSLYVQVKTRKVNASPLKQGQVQRNQMSEVSGEYGKLQVVTILHA